MPRWPLLGGAPGSALGRQTDRCLTPQSLHVEVDLPQGDGSPRLRPMVECSTVRSGRYAGAGSPVVLISGRTGSAKQLRDDRYVDPLAVARRVVNMDSRSGRPSRSPPQATRVDNLNPAIHAEMLYNDRARH